MFEVLYQDRHLVVIDKPPKIPVIPGREGGDSIVGQTGWRVCHRLDTDTSGVLVLARTAAGQRIVNLAFEARRVEKRYRAVCVGTPPALEGVVDLALGEWHRGRVGIGRGKPASTRWRVVAAIGGPEMKPAAKAGGECQAPCLRPWTGGRVWIDAEPLTGRTHQIRAHLASLGLPIVGDDAYGGPEGERILLHASRLVLPWPGRDDRLVLEAPLPEGFDPPGAGGPRPADAPASTAGAVARNPG